MVSSLLTLDRTHAKHVLYSLNRSLKVSVKVKVRVSVRVKVNNFSKIIQLIQFF